MLYGIKFKWRFVKSDNGLIYEGMKVADANQNPELRDIFNFADLDGDKIISKYEAEKTHPYVKYKLGNE